MDRAKPRHGAHRRGRLVGGSDSSLANPRPRADPLVGRIDHLLQVRVREDLGRRVAAPAGHVGAPDEGLGPGDRVVHRGSTSIRGCLALTRAPFSGITRTTRPARSDLISLKSFIASIRPINCPTATSRPAATKAADPGAGELYHTPGRGAFTLGRVAASVRPSVADAPDASDPADPAVAPGTAPPASR